MGSQIALLMKGKKAAIGAVSPDGRRKKVAEGKWGYVRQSRTSISVAAAKEKIRGFEEEIFTLDYEHGVILDKKGNIALNSRGGAHSFRLYGDEVRRSMGAKVFTHVHPTPLTLSPPDFVFGLYMGFEEVRETHSVNGRRVASSWVPDLDTIKEAEPTLWVSVSRIFEQSMFAFWEEARVASSGKGGGDQPILDEFYPRIVSAFGGVYTEEDDTGEVTKRIEGSFDIEKVESYYNRGSSGKEVSLRKEAYKP